MNAKIVFGNYWATFTPGKEPAWESNDPIWADLLNDNFQLPGPNVPSPFETIVKQAAKYFGAEIESMPKMPKVTEELVW